MLFVLTVFKQNVNELALTNVEKSVYLVHVHLMVRNTKNVQFDLEKSIITLIKTF